MDKLIAFGWYGGKYSHLDWLLPLLPAATHYCEPFGGSAAVLINRAPAPVETYNDLDGEVVNFFQNAAPRSAVAQLSAAQHVECCGSTQLSHCFGMRVIREQWESCVEPQHSILLRCDLRTASNNQASE